MNALNAVAQRTHASGPLHEYGGNSSTTVAFAAQSARRVAVSTANIAVENFSGQASNAGSAGGGVWAAPTSGKQRAATNPAAASTTRCGLIQYLREKSAAQSLLGCAHLPSCEPETLRNQVARQYGDVLNPAHY